MNVQCCVRVSASNFQVLTGKSGGVTRALGNIVRFLAGPARIQCDGFLNLLHARITRAVPYAPTPDV